MSASPWSSNPYHDEIDFVFYGGGKWVANAFKRAKQEYPSTPEEVLASEDLKPEDNGQMKLFDERPKGQETRFGTASAHGYELQTKKYGAIPSAMHSHELLVEWGLAEPEPRNRAERRAHAKAQRKGRKRRR